jgi:hypothetical protein
MHYELKSNAGQKKKEKKKIFLSYLFFETISSANKGIRT